MNDAPVRPTFRLLGVMKWVLVAGAALGISVGSGASLLYVRIRQPSASMWPTIGRGETYWARRGSDGPARGDVVVFEYPEQRSQLFAKRVVALAGDTLREDAQGALSINGWPIPRCAVGTVTFQDEEGAREGELSVEFLGVATYLVFQDRTGLTDAAREWRVEEGSYFVVGDNRKNSHDSRTWFGGRGGGVPLQNTRARAPRSATATLPSSIGTAALAPALAACLAKRPAVTMPPGR
ncbi:MAG: Signal peptidase [Labilithrix sp.]|nr:Signal peptidase [Labilithrix sp.]